MNTIQRRQLVKGRIVDAHVAKTQVSRSRRERADAGRALRKALAASRTELAARDTISYPR
ncbi:MAG TPA: hypothetical protein VK025_01280 [Steroidobacter sp.]|jgi:hypothetical protein|nr:hypothetical protein [Steroidobacteraceae bacterium]HLS80020.1 hypothetical protein [Steroidobacter sp.]